MFLSIYAFWRVGVWDVGSGGKGAICGRMKCLHQQPASSEETRLPYKMC